MEPRWKVLLTGVLLATFGVLVVTLRALTADAATAAPTPAEAVRRVLTAVQNGQYPEAAAYFEGGSRAWAYAPERVRAYLDQITTHGIAVTDQFDTDILAGDERHLLVITFSDSQRTERLRSATWTFVRKGDGWVIRKVE